MDGMDGRKMFVGGGGSSRRLYLLRTCSVAAVLCASGGAVGDRLGEGSE